MKNKIKMKNKITVIVPVYNGERTIKSCLRSLISAEPKEKRIIVVDNNSSDRTKDIAQSFKSVEVMEEKKKGAGAARNRALKETATDIVVFVDSDIILKKNTISELIKYIGWKNAAGVSGIPMSSNPDSIISLSQEIRLFGNSVFEKKTKKSERIATMIAAYKMSVLKEVNFFDENYYPSGEDVDLSYRIRKLGYSLLVNPRSKVYHNHPVSLKELAKKWFDYGIGWAKLSIEHNRLFDFLFAAFWILSLPVFLILSFLDNIFLLVFFIALLMPWILYYSFPTLKYLITKKDLRAFAFPFIHLLQMSARSLGIIYGIIKHKSNIKRLKIKK